MPATQPPGFENTELGNSRVPRSEQTGNTFVHAIVAVRNGIELDQEFLRTVRVAKTEGRSLLESIARTDSEKLGITFETCLNYLSKKIIYDLGKEEIIGLLHFRDVCFDKGLLDQRSTIQFVEV